jgi:hypothetical protein
MAPPHDAPSRPWPFWPVSGLFALGWLLFAWPWLSGAVTIPWDAKAHFLPQVQFLAASIAKGQSPFWTPYAFSGLPQIADPQSLIFSPPMLLLALADAAPSLRAIDSAVLLMVLIGGVGVLLLARDLGWHWAGALVAALCFSFGAAMAWRLQHFGQVFSLAYWPFAHLLLQRALTRGSILAGCGAGLVAAFIVLGRDQVGLLCVYLLAGAVVWHVATSDYRGAAIRRAALPLLAGGVLGAAVIALPILMTVLYAQSSNRPAIDYLGAGAGSLHPALFVTALVPHLFGAAGEMAKYWGPPSFTWEGTGLFIAQNMGQLYIGAAPVLLLWSALVRGVLWEREIRFYSIAAAFVVLYAIGWYTPAFRLFYEALPGVKLYRRPADAVFLIGAFGGLLAGYATHRLFTWSLPDPTRAQRVVEAALLIAGFSLALGLAVAFGTIDRATRPLMWASLWFAAALALLWTIDWLRVLNPVRAGVALAALLTCDLAWNNGPNGATALPPAEIDMLQPATRNETVATLKRLTAANQSDMRRDRIEIAGLGFHWPNASLTHGLENTLGYNPVRPRAYSEATGAGDIIIGPGDRKFTPLFPSYRSLLADLLGLRWIAGTATIEKLDPSASAADFPLAARTAEGFIYENPRALPRVLFVTESRQANFADLIRTGRWPDFDPRQTVLIEAPSKPATDRRSGSARILSYANTEVVIDAESPAGGFVVLNDMWHPWWQATVDDRRVPLQRANVLFRAVDVPPGRHRVVFRFAPVQGVLEQLRGASRAQ